MVIIETAAITAGGYAAYKGGKAAIKDVGKKMQRRKRENERKEDRKNLKKEIKEKQKLRASHLSEFQEKKEDGTKTSGIFSAIKPSKKKSSDTRSDAESRLRESNSKDRLERLRQQHQNFDAKGKKSRFPLGRK